MSIVEQAAKPKPEEHRSMAEEAMKLALQAVIPTLRQTFGRQANAEIAPATA